VQSRKRENDGRVTTRHLVDHPSLVKFARSAGPDEPDEESIMLGLYEWLREEIEAENAARRESKDN